MHCGSRSSKGSAVGGLDDAAPWEEHDPKSLGAAPPHREKEAVPLPARRRRTTGRDRGCQPSPPSMGSAQ